MPSYKKRREKLLTEMKDGVAIICAAHHQTRSHDTEYPFRQNSHFKYLTGLNTPESILVLMQNNKEVRTVLFMQAKDQVKEQWTGIRMGAEKAKEITGVDQAYDLEEFDQKIEGYLTGHRNLYIDLFSNHEFFNKLRMKAAGLMIKKRRPAPSPVNFIHLPKIIDHIRLIKEDYEIEKIKQAVAATTKGHLAGMSFVAPGKNEKELQGLIEYIFIKEGSDAPAYGTIAAGGVNGNILHYVENDKPLNDGEMVLVDAGAEYDSYASDVTRTYPINGKFTENQRKFYGAILEVQKKAIEMCRPGITQKDIHNLVVEGLTQALISLGVLSGDLEENIKNENFKKYFPHGTGHWMGLDVHDPNPYLADSGEDLKLEAGMVFTIEPGLYLPAEDANVPKEFRGMACRIEDDILITKTGYENLTLMIAKEIDEIEKICAADYMEYLK